MHYIFLSFVHEIIHKCEAKVTIILIEGHPFVTFERIGNYYKCNLTTMFLEQYCPLQRPFLSFFNTTFSDLFSILIKITHCQYPVRIFLQNGTTDFDETLHVV